MSVHTCIECDGFMGEKKLHLRKNSQVTVKLQAVAQMYCLSCTMFFDLKQKSSGRSIR